MHTTTGTSQKKNPINLVTEERRCEALRVLSKRNNSFERKGERCKLQLFPRIMRFVIFFAGARFQTRLGNCPIYISNRLCLSSWRTMGNRKVGFDLKECALRLWNTGWDIEGFHNALGVPRASIYRWESIFAECGTVNRPPSPIRGQELRILTRALMTVCEELFAEESDIYLNALATWLALTNDIRIQPRR
jgi:hypothetical protein